MTSSQQHGDRGDLAGVGVLVTRPAQQAEQLCALVEQAGGRALRFPVLEILDPVDNTALLALIDRLETFDLAIFISANAVNKAMNLVLARRPWPASLRIAAIGKRSARELEGFGHPADLYPQRKFDSEALLAMDALQDVSGSKVVIFRGDGGREYLGDTLAARGAEVEYAEAYRRGRPKGDTGRLMRYWARGEVQVITVSSNEGLRNLFDMVGKLGQQWLRKTPLVVPGERGAALARELGFREPAVIADNATDEAMFAALRTWVRSRPPAPHSG
ncbi:MAG: uroporphyrinogen-III synthase [Gammaproteobacteria bacterium]